MTLGGAPLFQGKCSGGFETGIRLAQSLALCCGRIRGKVNLASSAMGVPLNVALNPCDNPKFSGPRVDE